MTDFGVAAARIEPNTKGTVKEAEIKIGFVGFHLQSVAIEPAPWHLSPVCSAILGNDVWGRFKLFFDPARGTFSFTAAKP